jgi:hypothetical protein
MWNLPMISRIPASLIRRKTAFGVFHLKGSTDLYRNLNVEKLKTLMNGTWFDLQIDTIEITGENDLERYLGIRELRFSKSGYEYGGERGWKFGELSIWIGHVLAWTKFLESKFEYLILFEDDAILEHNFAGIIHEILRSAPKDWDVISLFTPESEFHRFKSQNLIHKTLVPVYQDWSALSYAISKKGAQNLLNSLLHSNDINLPIDWYLWRNIPRLEILALHPETLKPVKLELVESTFQQNQARLPLT